MSDHSADFDLPPRPHRDDGGPRRVGFELEFSGITLDETAAAVRSALDGATVSETPAERVVDAGPLGTFNIELDWDYLKRKSADVDRGEPGSAWLEQLGRAAAVLVPVEVVCPPIAVTDLAALQPMVAALRAAGAIGTEESLIAAYGVHVNAEIPRLDAETLSAYLRAYALLQWWLVDAHDVDATRRLSPYIDLYPEAYLKRVLARPTTDIDEMFDDYLTHNATRNRALDLLPMLAAIDEQRVRRAVDDPKIKARPAFHYRLPNCHIERAGWSLSGPWNLWCVLERLAGRPDDLEALAAAFLRADRPVLGVGRADWVAWIDRWLRDHGLA